MSVIKITKKDEVSLKLKTDPSTLQEICDYFTFDVPNAKFHPMYRSRMWDGKIRIVSMMVQELPIGLLEYLKAFAKENGYTVDDSEYYPACDETTIEEVREFCESLNLTSNGKPIAVRDYQIDAIYRAISNGRRLLLSPTGSGKSLIIYCLIRWHQANNRNQLIVVPTTSLVEQMKNDFIDYSTANGWDHSCIHTIYGGSEKLNTHEVVITTWQSVYKMHRAFFAPFQVIYGDEAHLFKAKSLTSIFNKCTDTPFRIGTTGTLDGTQTHKLVLEGMFGPVYKVTTTKELIEANQLAELKIHCVQLCYDEEERKICKDYTYQQEIDYIVGNERRNKFLRNLAITQKGNTLVLFQFVEKHGKLLYEMIKNKVHEERKVFFVYGATDTEAREDVRRITEKENDAIIVASFGTFSTGINIRNLHNVVFASPSKSRIRNLQSLGRGLRKSDTKTKCKLFDIGDDLSWKSHKNYTLLHMIERIKIYNEEGLDYSIVKVNLNV